MRCCSGLRHSAAKDYGVVGYDRPVFRGAQPEAGKTRRVDTQRVAAGFAFQSADGNAGGSNYPTGPLRGRWTVKVVPCATEDSTSIRPPCACAIRSAM
jgi:hypothetical protein